jgi:hypothetical protein
MKMSNSLIMVLVIIADVFIVALPIILLGV